MRFEVLGPLVVRDDDGDDVTPRGVQQRRFLTALVATAPAPLPVDRLTELLWPSGPPSANALQALASKMRKAVAPVAITSDQRGYALDLAPEMIDVHRFEELVARGDSLAATDPAEAHRLFCSAESLVRGRPFDDIADDDLARGESVRLERQARTARCRRLELDLGQPEHLGAAEAELEVLTMGEPLDERWWALLMTAQYRQGRQADALRTFQAARRVLADELGLDPGPELRDLEQRILTHDPALAPQSPAGSHRLSKRRPRIPSRRTSIVGRDELLGELRDELARSRLVTLLGPGGAGKTTLAAEVARRAIDRPLVFVELAPLSEPDSIVPGIAATLGISAGDTPAGVASASTMERIIEVLIGTSTLLVLDNCEHVVDFVAKAVHELLDECPDLVVLATSREALGVPGETVRLVPPLDVDDAAQLFIERATTAAPELAPADLDPRIVVEICSRLDRLPLAIELAAARVKSMQLGELLDRLDDRFLLLASGPRTVEPRQQALRAVVDWSHDLLDDIERAVFRRLAAFSGGAALGAAELICADPDLPSQRVGAVIERLIDKSLVAVDRSSGSVRYTMLEILAEYATERLAESGEVERVRAAHAEYFADLIAPAMRGLLGHGQRTWIDTITNERENLRVALDVAVARGDANLALRLTAPIGWYFYMVGQPDLGAAALEDALGCPGPVEPGLRAIVLAHYGWLAANGPHIGTALDATDEAIALVTAADDAWLEAFVVVTRILALFFSGQLDEVHSLVPAAEDATKRSGDRWAEALMALLRAELAQYGGTQSLAEAEFREAVRLFEEVGDEFSLAITLTEAAEIAELRGDYDHALEMIRRGIELSDRVGFSSKPLAMRARQANVETLRGNTELAERLHLELLEGTSDEAVPWVRTMSYAGLATIARRTDRPHDAERWIEDAWRVTRSREVPVMQSIVLVGRGYCADLVGDHARAMAHQRDALRLAVVHCPPRGLANSLEGVAGALAIGPAERQWTLGAQLLGAADALRRASGGPMPAAERFDVDRAERRCRAALGDQAFDEWFDLGARSDVHALVTTILE